MLVNHAGKWRSNLTLQVKGKVQIAPVNLVEDQPPYGVFSVDTLGMPVGTTIVLTEALDKVKLVQKPKRCKITTAEAQEDVADDCEEIDEEGGDERLKVPERLLSMVDLSGSTAAGIVSKWPICICFTLFSYSKVKIIAPCKLTEYIVPFLQESLRN